MNPWISHSPPVIIGRLIIAEPMLAKRIICWRWNDGLEAVTLDRRGRYWLWREQRSPFVKADGDVRHGVGSGTPTGDALVMVPLYGPVAPTNVLPLTLADMVRAAVLETTTASERADAQAVGATA